MNAGDVLERRAKVDYLADFMRVESLSTSGKSVRVVECNAGGARIPAGRVHSIRAWRVPLDFLVHAKDSS